MAKFNINNYIKIKLTKKGVDILTAKKPYLLKDVDNNGWLRIQLWEGMQVFGEYMFNGCDLLFETEIQIIDA